MSSPAFDTHRAYQTLKEAGADDRLAEAVVATVGLAVGGAVATKSDLKDIRTELELVKTNLKNLGERLDTRINGVQSEMENLEQRLNTRIGNLEQHMTANIKLGMQRVTIILGGMLVTGVGALAALLVLLR